MHACSQVPLAWVLALTWPPEQLLKFIPISMALFNPGGHTFICKLDRLIKRSFFQSFYIKRLLNKSAELWHQSLETS
jgi:hypothetical protein